MGLSAFSAPGRFYRGNLHTHSTRSDGAIDPAEVCRRYKAEGYDFISLTDHFVGRFDYPIVDTRPFHDAEFTTIPGAELHSGRMENGYLWHILAVGLPYDFAPSNSPDFHPVDDQETGPQIAQRARDAGAFVAVAHPQWSGMTLGDAMSIEAAHAVEIYNHSCAVDADRPDGLHVAELMLTAGRDLTLIATDDAHFEDPDHFGGWVMVKATANNPDALLAALKSGQFYASQGPELHDITLDGATLRVESSAVERLIVAGPGIAAQSWNGTSLTRHEVDISRFVKGSWFRVAVIDRAGLRAWSNPILL